MSRRASTRPKYARYAAVSDSNTRSAVSSSGACQLLAGARHNRQFIAVPRLDRDLPAHIQPLDALANGRQTLATSRRQAWQIYPPCRWRKSCLSSPASRRKNGLDGILDTCYAAQCDDARGNVASAASSSRGPGERSTRPSVRAGASAWRPCPDTPSTVSPFGPHLTPPRAASAATRRLASATLRQSSSSTCGSGAAI